MHFKCSATYITFYPFLLLAEASVQEIDQVEKELNLFGYSEMIGN